MDVEELDALHQKMAALFLCAGLKGHDLDVAISAALNPQHCQRSRSIVSRSQQAKRPSLPSGRIFALWNEALKQQEPAFFLPPRFASREGRLFFSQAERQAPHRGGEGAKWKTVGFSVNFLEIR